MAKRVLGYVTMIKKEKKKKKTIQILSFVLPKHLLLPLITPIDMLNST